MEQHKPVGTQPPSEEELLYAVHHSIGASCEVRTQEDVTLCIASVKDVKGDAVFLESRSGEEMPSVVFNTTCKLMIRPKKKTMMILWGTVCGSSPAVWKLDRLKPFLTVEHRAYFRQPVSAEATAVCANELFHPGAEKAVWPGKEQRCQVKNISLGGIQILSAERFMRNDLLLVQCLNLLPENDRAYRFFCQVCWADRVSREEFLFGCRLLALTEQEQDLLSQDIFALQRQDLTEKRKKRIKNPFLR